MSYAGKRAMVAMKHVGLNVAADGFINSAITGVNGGLIIVSADDPSMHSSQNEQDSRFYGKFAFVPCFEPSNQQEAYDMVFDAFEVSEKYKTTGSFQNNHTSGSFKSQCKIKDLFCRRRCFLFLAIRCSLCFFLQLPEKNINR